MILYSTGTWGMGFIFRIRGSVFPKAACWAVPNAAMAFLLHYFFHPEDDSKAHMMTGVNWLFAAWSSVLGFLVVFRNNQAYGRFWEGATIVSQVRGNWFNAVSNLIAFCSKDPARHQQVEQFQHLLVRLSSMLYCAALQQICDLRDDTLEIIDPRGMSPESLDYLQNTNDRCEVLLQWIQQLIVDGERNSVLAIAPPILSRVFQELSNGIVSLNNVRKIRDIPFPFPYAQMITCMLTLQFCFTPIFAAYVVETRTWAAIMCFLYSGSYACLIYIPNEIDQPFGADANDLPLADMQRDYNKSLLHLLDPLTQQTPAYKYDKELGTCIVESGFGLRSRIRKDSLTSLGDAFSCMIGQGGSTIVSGSLALTSRQSTFRQSLTNWNSEGSQSPTNKKKLPKPEDVPISLEASDTSSTLETSIEGSKQREADDLICEPPPSSRRSHMKAAQRAAAASKAQAMSESGYQRVVGDIFRQASPTNSGSSTEDLKTTDGKAHKLEERPQASLNLYGDWVADLEEAEKELSIAEEHGSLSPTVVKTGRQASNDTPMTPHGPPMTRLAVPTTPPVTLR